MAKQLSVAYILGAWIWPSDLCSVWQTERNWKTKWKCYLCMHVAVCVGVC